ncbi:diguanylate cyclase domain-containing protein [Butyrivibrio sp. FCS014]|uniref:diguanylate cyclase domain-containing protein n=1 Tax=Butyrivibrio sp. FCS014 TaxID=1408304 RepID=UPI0004675057|nr:GGDEF domain-containing protein [Butyrivibrio sp. FCS014]
MSRSKKIIAFMGGMIDEEKNCYFIRAMEQQCRKNGYLMIVFGFSETTFSDQDRNNCEMKLIQMAGLLDLKAIIMHLEFIKNDYLIEAFKNLAREKGIPIVAMERNTEGCLNISMRYKNGFEEMVRHVVEFHGCRKVNMMAGLRGDHFSETRIEAYKTVLQENGIPIEEKRIGYGDFWDRPARAATRKFLEDGDVPEAIVCANDNMAIAVSDELQKLGYKVPEDVIVTGFDGVNKCLFKQPSISTVAPDYMKEAYQIIEMIKYNEGNPLAEGHDKVDFLLRLRGSCGCNRSWDTLSSENIKNLSEYYDDVNWAVTSVNSLFSQAAILETLTDLSKSIEETLWLWKRDFQFAAVYSDLLRDEIEDLGPGKYTPFFCYRDGEATGIGQPYNEDVFFPDFESFIESGNIHVMIVKLLHSGNRIFGYMVEGAEDTNDRDVRRCEEFGMFISSAINIVAANRNLIRMHREIAEASLKDYLTGIFNRRGFFGELERLITMAPSRGMYLTVFSIDMDGLKRINDDFGHADGDFAIQCMAEAIHHVASRNGISARYGGDEFACAMITENPIYLSADTFRDRVAAYLAGRPDVADKDYVITASVGSAMALIDDRLNIEQLIKEADDAMYEDKRLKNSRK